jgi:hypothetical protein
MENKERKRSSLMLVLAIIAASLIVIWVITLFDKMDDPASSQRSNNRTIKQTITNTHGYDFFSLLRLEKDYT